MNCSSNKNIIIRAVTTSTINVQVGDEIIEIKRQLGELLKLLKKGKTIQTAEKIYNIQNINKANFNNIIERVNRSQEFPESLRFQIVDNTEWIDSFEDDLLNIGVNYSHNKLEVFGHFGWLIQDYLRKLITFEDELDNPDEAEEQDETQLILLKISYMAEAFHSSLRYLCYIQMAQLFQSKAAYSNPRIREFIHQSYETIDQFDYQDFLLNLTALIDDNVAFVPEINVLVKKLSANIDDELYDTVLYLEKYRHQLLNESINVEEVDTISKEYLTALIFWLRKLVFLAKYRLVSIKNIDLNYRFGSPTYFEHLYGELHGFYKESFSQFNQESSAYETLRLKDKYTYNRSVLLLKGDHLKGALRNINDTNDYLSLSPLVVDYSVFAKAESGQTPEIYYYRGKTNKAFYYCKYNNELPFLTHSPRLQCEKIAAQNTEKPKLNQLYKHIISIFKSFKAPKK